MHLGPLLELFPPDRKTPSVVPEGPKELGASAGGVTLLGGLYRWHDVDAADRWTQTAAAAFPTAAKLWCFAADWLGRQFAIAGPRGPVLLLDVGAGQALEIPISLTAFHEEELVEHHDAALGSGFYAEWRTAAEDERPLRPDECVGYTLPLFLGGSDSVENLARTDTEVYWSLTTQMLAGLQ